MRILYIFTLIMISTFAKSQNLNCVDFKIGTFKLEITNYNLPSTTVYRSDKNQKETSEGLKEPDATIEWKSECSYELLYLNASPEMNGKKVNVEIIKIEGQKALCSSTFESMP